MKIYGIGIDVINISRIKRLLKNKLFLKRVYATSEINQCNSRKNKVSCYASRFAAKEAFTKALGTGFRKGLEFNDIIVTKNLNGRPSIKLSGKSKNIVKKILKKKFNFYLSISDDLPYSIAIVIIAL